MMPFGVLVSAGFVLFMVYGWHFRNKYQIAIFCIPLLFGLVVNYIVARRSLNILEALPAAIRTAAPKIGTTGDAESNSSLTGSSQDTAAELSAADQALLRTSRPREIRMSATGKFSVTAATLMAIGFAAAIAIHLNTLWVPTHSLARFQTKDWITAVLAVLLLLLPYGIWRGQVKECDLLQNGEVAIARVTRQWRGDKSSTIEYEFKDSMGQTRRSTANDTSRKLYEGMSVPVFYDRENPARQVAYCSTLHEIES